MKKIWYAPNKNEAYGEDEINAVTECLKDGWLAGFGKRTTNFEKRVSKLFGKKYGVFCNSGSSAVLLALASLDLEKGSEVVTPACTFSTTVAPIIQLGLKPVFCDVELKKYVPSVEQIMSVVTEKTKCIIVPNLIGNSMDWKELRGKTKLPLIEDSADTIVYNPYSDISTTSFYASHLITAGGSGGMVMFNCDEQKKIALMYRDWGRIGDNKEEMSDRFNHNVDGIPYDYKFLYGVLGYNFKSSEMNAAFGLAQLDRFEEIKFKRRTIIERYIENLKDVEEITLPDDSRSPNWLAIPLMYEKRLDLLKYLENNNIQTRVCFAGNITRHPVYRHYLEDFKNSDLIMRNSFLLGAHHGMSIEDVDYVCDKIKQFVNMNR